MYFEIFANTLLTCSIRITKLLQKYTKCNKKTLSDLNTKQYTDTRTNESAHMFFQQFYSREFSLFIQFIFFVFILSVRTGYSTSQDRSSS